MSMEKQDDQCSGCMPALIDATTGEVLKEDNPMMKAILSVWATTTREEREAFHDFTCLNSRDPKVMKIMDNMNVKFTAAMEFAHEQEELKKNGNTVNPDQQGR